MSTGTDSSPVRVGLAGLGRSGWDIHAATFNRLRTRYTVAAVADAQEGRRAEAVATFGCRAYASFEELVRDPSVELIVVATPSHLHSEQAIEALGGGKHVVVEKPMATSTAAADAMIAAARRAGRHLAVFLNRRYDPHLLQVLRVIDSGVLGRIVQVRIALHGFNRRWDWQTLKGLGGGTLNNTGPHFLDQALQIFGDAEPEVFCHLDTALTLGDADDHAVILLRHPGAPLVQLEMTSACAHPQDFWLIMGTRGSMRGSVHELHWKVADFSHLPQRTVAPGPSVDRSYETEDIKWETHSWRVPDEQRSIEWTQDCYYRDLYESIRSGAPLKITAQSVRRQIAVMDRCRAVGERTMTRASPDTAA